MDLVRRVYLRDNSSLVCLLATCRESLPERGRKILEKKSSIYAQNNNAIFSSMVIYAESEGETRLAHARLLRDRVQVVLLSISGHDDQTPAF